MLRRIIRVPMLALLTCLLTPLSLLAQSAGGVLGYYRYPTIHGDNIVFVAEGDLWRVGVAGGVAQRLTTHLAEETQPAISPDGRTVAFTARYDGVADIYTIPLGGGLPRRHSWDAGSFVAGWTPDGRILYRTGRYSTLPNAQLVSVNPANNERTLVPLWQASDGVYDVARKNLFFVRLPFQGSFTKRYQGGTVENIWRVAERGEAVPLTADYAGTSKEPMWWNGRVYFASDRDGVMNLWSMDENGKQLVQHTFHKDYDVQSPAMHEGRIVYQQGADLWLLDLRQADVLAKASNQAANGGVAVAPAKLAVYITSDLDQLRDRWVKKPMDYVTDFHVSNNGDRVALVARGLVFVAPVGQGRLVQLPNNGGVRYREARFAPDGKSLYVLSDKSGEVELWRVPANGVGEAQQLTNDAEILRWDIVVSPDGKYLAHHNKNQELFVYDVAAKSNKRIATSSLGGFWSINWSPDSKWLTFNQTASNQIGRIMLYNVASGQTTALTSDRYDSWNATFSNDGQWLYFLSDRTFNTTVGSPWGARQPEPYFNSQTKIYALQLTSGARFPFAAKTELDPDSAIAPTPNRPIAPMLSGVRQRIFEVPIPAGNYNGLDSDGKRLYYTSREQRYGGGNSKLMSLEIKNEDVKAETFMDGINSYEITGDQKKILVRKGSDLYVVPVGAKAPTELAKHQVNLSDWTFQLERKDELKSLFVDAWRLERDYFYDPNMHGVDWAKQRQKYLPLAERVTDRSELNDVIAQMVGELSALHIFVRGGDMRASQDTIEHASLGAVLEKADRGWRVAHIYQSDPDIPNELSPLARPGVNINDGDVIVAINGVPTLSVEHPAELLYNKADKQVLLTVRDTRGSTRDVVITPISLQREFDLRYDEWEYTRRLLVDKLSNGRVGYVHLRAMGGGNMAEFYREYYPVYNREALIVDVRRNNGGNIDSWILEKLMRKAWFYWQPRVGEPYWNMQYAFRGPMTMLIDQNTASDGEAVAEGFRRLGLGKLIGMRTWGGEIWLSASNFLADRGIATAAETGVYGPDGSWLIEGHGVDPDIVLDNLPVATFNGSDAQLERAVNELLEQLRRNPNPVPKPKPYPNKRN